MESHQGVELFKIHSCSVHSLGTNQETHLDWNILALTLIGEYALNGWVDDILKKSHPRFHSLEPHIMEQAHYLINGLYIVYVPKFKPDGSLYPDILEATYSMVV